MKYKVIYVCNSAFTVCEKCSQPCLSSLEEYSKEYQYLILDIGKVKSMNSTLLSSILKYKNQLIICNPNPISLNILTILGVDKFIKVFYTVDDAISYIEEGSGVRETVSHRK